MDAENNTDYQQGKEWFAATKALAAAEDRVRARLENFHKARSRLTEAALIEAIRAKEQARDRVRQLMRVIWS